MIDTLDLVIDTIVAIAFRALMTQHLHLESITSSYHELAEANRTLRLALFDEESKRLVPFSAVR